MILILSRLVADCMFRFLFDRQWRTLAVSKVEAERGLMLSRIHSSLLIFCLDRGVFMVLFKLRIFTWTLRTSAVEKRGNW